ncbi:MAG: hypothetical protein L6276_09340 [Acetobacterium sp.]|nr:hypothetical protein [Bacillota bacterium]MCG2730467.1 hypothetical protein [Acetobacterium sp.]
MKIKIIKQFGAAIAAVLIVYGVVATTYRSYETVMAAQVEIPPAIVVKNTIAEVVTETVTPAVTAAETPMATMTETATVAAAPVEPTTTVAAAAAPTQEVIVPETSTSTAQEEVVTEPVPVVPSLSEFLSQFRCGGCGKNCSLVNPRCNVGSQKAQQAESEYYATYS